MSKFNRITDTRTSADPHTIANTEYNQQAGAMKTMPAGAVLLPIPNVVSGQSQATTNATSTLSVPSLGRNIAVYNNANAVGSITLGTSAPVTSLAPGAVSTDYSQAGIPCQPNSWTYIALGPCQFFIASAATLLCYLIDDGSYLIQEKS